MRTPHFRGLSRLWDYLFDDWSTRLAKLGLGPRRSVPRKSRPGWKPSRFTLEILEDRLTPDGRPLPLPFVFAGVGSGAPPVVRAYYADTGELAYERTPFDAGFMGGVRVAAGDIDHDGIPDLIAAAGAGAGSHVKVYSGVDGAELRSFYAYDEGFTGGVNVASGDVNGDGTADIITAAGAGAGPHIKVFSGVDNGLLASFYAFAPDFKGGATVAAADFTGDGKADLIVGAGAGAGPHVMVFDLSTTLPVPPPIGSFYAFDSSFTGGVDVGTDSLAGDVTGDGVSDIVVGRGAGAGSLVRVFDGVSGKQVLEFSPFGSAMTVRVATAYVDDDEFADVIVGSGAGVASVMKVLSGVTGLELASPMGSYAPFGNGHTGGVFVAGSNDPVYQDAFVIYGGTSGAASASLTLSSYHYFSNPNGPPLLTPTGSVVFTAFPPNHRGPPLALGTVVLTSLTPGYSGGTLTVPGDTFTAPGVYNIRAAYSGDGNFYAETRYHVYTVTGAVAVLDNRVACKVGVAGSSGAANTGGVAKTTSGVEDNGTVSVALLGVGGDGFGAGLSNAVFWSNATGYAEGITGDGTQIGDWGRIADTNQGNGSLAVITSSNGSVNFDYSGGVYTSQFGHPATLTLNSTTNEYKVTGGDGSKQIYYDRSSAVAAELRGKLKSKTDAAGNTIAVTGWDGTGRPLALEKTDAVTSTAKPS